MRIVYHVFRRSSSEGPVFLCTSFPLFRAVPRVLRFLRVRGNGAGRRFPQRRNDRPLDNRVSDGYIISASIRCGESLFEQRMSGGADGFPAFAGMVRCTGIRQASRRQVPRAGGDEPISSAVIFLSIAVSPRLWGWSVLGRMGGTVPDVSPRLWGWSAYGGAAAMNHRVSPRLWGWSATGAHQNAP